MLLPLETPTLPFMVRSAPPFEVSRSAPRGPRCAAPQGVRGSGDNFETKIFKCRWFLGRHGICQKFTQPDFQAKIFTPQNCVICDIFLALLQHKCIKYQ